MSRLGWRRGLMEEVTQADKVQKENSTSVASNAHGEKYRKPKPTKPKPFRFRTDERGMFKEATLEKKVHAPLKEITLIRTPGAKSTSKHQNVIQAKHWSSWSYLEEQRRMGFLVLHEVCVLDGHPSCLRRRKFDVTIFNFPHAVTVIGREKCAGPYCTNPLEYQDSQLKLPLCSVQCYKAIHRKMALLSAC